MKANLRQIFFKQLVISSLTISLLIISSCSTGNLKGHIHNYFYYPSIGNLRCESLDTNQKFIREKFSQYGGVIDIWNAGFPYRVDMHFTTSKLDSSEFDYKDYFSYALQHLKKDFPKGNLVDQSVEEFGNKRVYYAALFYPKHRGGLSNAFEMVDSYYKNIVIYKGDGIIYTFSNNWSGFYESPPIENYEKNLEYIKNNARRLFNQCEFGIEWKEPIPVKQIYPETINIKIVDSPNYKNELLRYVNWSGENYSPGAFIAVVKNSTVKNINISNTDKEMRACAAYLGKELKIKIYNVSNNEYQKIAEKANKTACTYSE